MNQAPMMLSQIQQLADATGETGVLVTSPRPEKLARELARDLPGYTVAVETPHSKAVVGKVRVRKVAR